MIRYEEPAASYHAIQAFSAGLAWDIVGPDGCLALARARSPWLNPDYVPERNEVMDAGVIGHLASLEQHLLDQRIVIIDATSYRTKAAQELRDSAYAAGKIPILLERDEGSPGPSFQKVMAMREALQKHPLASWLLFNPRGDSEVSYDWMDESTGVGVHCKARADRIVSEAELTRLVDLKTAASVSPDGFQRSMVRFGHHLRAAFYLDGWDKQDADFPKPVEYVFVCVRAEPPHLVAVYTLPAQALDWGRKLYRRAITQFELAYSGQIPWSSYTLETRAEEVDLPTWLGYRLADQEAAGEL